MIKWVSNNYKSNPDHQMICELVILDIKILEYYTVLGNHWRNNKQKKEFSAKLCLYEMLYVVINIDKLFGQSFITYFYRTKHELETL